MSWDKVLGKLSEKLNSRLLVQEEHGFQKGAQGAPWPQELKKSLAWYGVLKMMIRSKKKARLLFLRSFWGQAQDIFVSWNAFTLQPYTLAEGLMKFTLLAKSLKLSSFRVV